MRRTGADEQTGDQAGPNRNLYVSALGCPSLVRCGLVNLAVAASYFLTGWGGLQLSSYADSITLVWAPVGIALAAVILIGARAAPGILVGSLLVNLTTTSPPGVVVAIMVGNTAGPVIAGLVLRNRSPFRPQLDEVGQIVAFVLIGVLGCCLITSTIGALALVLLSGSPWSELPIAWSLWLAGDACWVLIVTPVLLTWLTRLDQPQQTSRSTPELAWLVIGLILAGSLMLIRGRDVPELAYTPFPFLLWAALRFGPRGASAVTLAITTTALVGTATGLGPFVDGETAIIGGEDQMLSLWVFFIITAISALVLTTLRAERNQALHEVEQMMHELDHRVKNTLATVLAVARQSSVGVTDLAEYIESLTGRLEALARSHEALARTRWKGQTVREVVEHVLAPFDADRTVLSSAQTDEKRLAARVTGPLAMTLYELATNSLKYGAWSSERGTVEISWQDTNGDVRLVWRENGGPPVRTTGKPGYGLRIIESLIEYELKGTSSTEFAEDGLVCTLLFPIGHQ